MKKLNYWEDPREIKKFGITEAKKRAQARLEKARAEKFKSIINDEGLELIRLNYCSVFLPYEIHKVCEKYRRDKTISTEEARKGLWDFSFFTPQVMGLCKGGSFDLPEKITSLPPTSRDRWALPYYILDEFEEKATQAEFENSKKYKRLNYLLDSEGVKRFLELARKKIQMSDIYIIVESHKRAKDLSVGGAYRTILDEMTIQEEGFGISSGYYAIPILIQP